MFNGSARGPVFGPNFVEVTYDTDGESQTVQIYPDICNDDLRNTGNPMSFYIMPSTVRMAKDESGKYMFSFTKFEGVLDEGGNIGVTGEEQVAGGTVSLSATLALPDGVIDGIKEKLIAEIKADQKFKEHALYRMHTDSGQDVSPNVKLGFIPIIKNEIAMSSLTMNDLTDPSKQATDDKWLWLQQGAGDGNLDPNGTNAFTAMLGQYPASLVEAGFHGDTAPIFIHDALQLQFWAPPTTITVDADYNKVFNSFSSDNKHKDNWAQSDIQQAVENNFTNGVCTVKIIMGDAEVTDKNTQLYLDMANEAKKGLMDLITKNMFTTLPKPVDPAKAKDTTSQSLQAISASRSSSWFGFFHHTNIVYGMVTSDNGDSYALNSSFDAASMHLQDNTSITKPYILTQVVSGNMHGFYQDIQKNPDTEKEYFSSVNLGDAFKMIRVIATARANWPAADGTGGDPIDKLQMSVAAFDKIGNPINLMPRSLDPKTLTFSAHTGAAIWTAGNKDMQFVFDFAIDDNVPTDKRKEVTISRTVYYKEDPRVKINTDNVVIVAPEVTALNFTPEVSANLVGHLNVGPIFLAADLNKHMLVEVTCKKEGFEDYTMLFTLDNLTQKQRYELWTNETGEIAWSYKVKVTYKSFGPLDAIVYEGDEVTMSGSYANGISINLPKVPDNLIQQLTDFKAQSKQLDSLDL